MINAILIDDELKAIESLKWELANFCPEVTILGVFTDPEKAYEYIVSTTEIDCIFLDIMMPGLDGFQLLNKLPNKDFAVIFTTASDQYGINAIKENALDYLLKPVDSDDLILAIKKVKGYLKQNNANDKFEESLIKIVSEIKSSGKKIGLNTDGKIIFLMPEEIIYCEADGNYTTVYLEKKRKLFITQTLKKVEEKLTSPEFFRVHNSYLINLTKIKEYVKTESYIVLNNDINIPVARQKKSIFLDQF